MTQGFFDSVQEWIDAGMPLNSFICGDCMQGMAAMPEKFADLAIVDPPYGIGVGEYDYFAFPHGVRASSGTRNKSKEWDSEKVQKTYFNDLFKVAANQIIFGANYYSDMLPVSRGWIAWDKKHPDNISFSQFELAWSSFDSICKMFRIYPTHVVQGEKIHPTQKPTHLYRWLLQNYAKSGQIILDTHVGSASSLIACEKMGFPYVGFEIDRDYFDAACNRILQARELLKQEDMFAPKPNGKVETIELF